MAVSLVLLGSSAGLAGLLEHDGVGIDHAAAAQAPLGSHVRLRGLLSALPPSPSSSVIALPDGPLPVLEGLVPQQPFRFLIEADGGVRFIVLSTTDQAPGTVIVDATIVARLGGDLVTIPVASADAWTRPILFR